MNNKKMSKRHAFTLVELLVVITVLAILASVTVVSYTKFTKKAKDSNDLNLVEELNRNLMYDNTIEPLTLNCSQDVDLWLESKGIDNLETTDDNKTILYNKKTNQFELVRYSDLEDKLITKRSKMASKEAPEKFVVNESPVSYAELFNGYIISSQNNDLYYTHKLVYDINKESLDKATTIVEKYNENINNIFLRLALNTIYVTSEGIVTLNGSEYVNEIDGGIRSFLSDYRYRNIYIMKNVKNVVLDEVANADSSVFATEFVNAPIPSSVEKVELKSEPAPKIISYGNVKTVTEESKENLFTVKDSKEADDLKTDLSKVTFITEFAQLKEALQNKDSYQKIAITNNLNIVEDIEIPDKTTVILPYYYSGSVYKDYRESSNRYGGSTVNDAKETVTTIVDLNVPAGGITSKLSGTLVTVSDSATVTLRGNLIVGGITSTAATSDILGHTSGAYAQINNNGSIIVSGGKLDVYGYIKGTGIITALNLGAVVEPIIIGDLQGGTISTSLSSQEVLPFTKYSIANIQNKIIVKDGEVSGRIDANMLGSHKISEALIIGTSRSKKVPFVKLGDDTHNNAYAEITYDSQKTLNGSKFEAVGRTNIAVYGGGKTNSFSMDFSGIPVNTSDMIITIPYNLNLIFNDGNYDVDGKLLLLPGSVVTVSENALLNINEGGQLYVANGLKQNKILVNGNAYTEIPQGNEYFDTFANLVVNGTVVIKTNGIFGGLIQTKGPNATVVVEENARINNFVDNWDGKPTNGSELLSLRHNVNTYVNDQMCNLVFGCLLNSGKSANLVLIKLKAQVISNEGIVTDLTSGTYKSAVYENNEGIQIVSSSAWLKNFEEPAEGKEVITVKDNKYYWVYEDLTSTVKTSHGFVKQ